MARALARHVGLTTAADRDRLTNADMFHIMRLALAQLREHPLDKGLTRMDMEAAQTHPAAPLLRQMARTYNERRAIYGPSEQKYADICMAHFPNGLTLKAREDWVRWGLLHMILSKLARYTHDFHTPHVDSIHDAGPYSAMLEAEDRRMLGLMPFGVARDTP